MKSWLCGLLLIVVLAGCSTGDLSDHRYVWRPADSTKELPELTEYFKPSPETLRNIKVARVLLTPEERARLSKLPNDKDEDVTWLKEIDPDTSRAGPWNTQLYVFNNNDANHCMRVDLIDHASGGVRHEWLNDEILFVKVWWGHVAFTDFILDISTGRFVYMRDGFEYPATEDLLLK